MEDDIFINFKYFVENTIKFNKVPNNWDILQLVTSNVIKYKSFKKRTWKHWDSRYWCTAFILSIIMVLIKFITLHHFL